MAEEERFVTPFGSFSLGLHQPDATGSLRAWDAADEYLLDELGKSGLPAGARIAIFNDSFGALTTALRVFDPVVFLDSARSRFVVNENLRLNGLEAIRDFTLPPLQAGLLSHVCIKIPKSLRMLEDQLRLVSPFLKDDARVIGAGMTRHIHRSTIDCFAAIIGVTESSRARKRARLIFSLTGMYDSETEPVAAPEYTVPGIPAPLVNLPGIFSAERLDPGTAVFLKTLTIPEGPVRILDFGCGNGVIGIFAALRNHEAEVTALDDSAAAAESAALNAACNGLAHRLKVLHAFSLDSASGRFDLILSNPPFHQGARISLDASLEMFQAAAGKLVPGGGLCIVANRHLGYAAHLRRLFGNCRERAGTGKFTVLEATRRR